MNQAVMKKIAALIAVAVFGVTFAIYSLSMVVARTDTIWSLYVAESIVQTGNADLDEYVRLKYPYDYRIEIANGHRFSIFPVGAPLMAAPLVGLLEFFPIAAGGRLSDYLASHQPDEVVFQIEKTIASFLAALSCVFMYATARQRLPIAKSLLFAGIFAFASANWSIASRALWQHGPTILCLSIALYLLSSARQNPARAALAGLPLAYSFIVRPTNAISIAVVAAYILVSYRRFFGGYVLCVAIVLVPLVAFNYASMGALITPLYGRHTLGITPSYPPALAGNLFSPARGLFVFSPIFAVSVFGLFRALRRSSARLHDLNLYAAAIVLIHWLAISAFAHWWGGWTVGPRYMSDVVPYLAFMILPALDSPGFAGQKVVARQAGRLAFAILAAISIFAHFRSATDLRTSEWNAIPVDVDRDPRRLWDWSDLQFLRGLCPAGSMEAPRCWLAPAPRAGEEPAGGVRREG